jgi:hypothetical protein
MPEAYGNIPKGAKHFSVFQPHYWGQFHQDYG